MNFIFDLNLQFAHSIHSYLNDIALAIVATCLVVYGNDLNDMIRRMVASWVFILRVIAFILMCTFGYGLLTVWLEPLLESLLRHIPLVYLPISTIAIFCLLGVLAERKRNI